MSLGKRIRKSCLLVVLLLATPINLSASQDITPEEVKASYILKFRPFVKLGSSARSIRQICYFEKPGVAEKESVGQILAKYLRANPPKTGEEISVKWYQAVSRFSDCDLLYIPADEEDSIDDILSKVGSSPILTVSAAKRFIFRGGMIGFTLDDSNRVRLEGNTKRMKENDVEVDAQVLEIMQQVISQ